MADVTSWVYAASSDRRPDRCQVPGRPFSTSGWPDPEPEVLFVVLYDYVASQ